MRRRGFLNRLRVVTPGLKTNAGEGGLALGATGGLTLPSATADLPEAGALAQTVEPLLFDQLHDLRLDLLSQLSSGKKEDNTPEDYVSLLFLLHPVVLPTGFSGPFLRGLICLAAHARRVRVYLIRLSYIDPSGGARPTRGRPVTHLGNLKRILFQLRCVNRTPFWSFIEVQQTPAEPQWELLISKVFSFA